MFSWAAAMPEEMCPGLRRKATNWLAGLFLNPSPPPSFCGWVWLTCHPLSLLTSGLCPTWAGPPAHCPHTPKARVLVSKFLSCAAPAQTPQRNR